MINGILTTADQNPVKVGDNLTIVVNTNVRDGGIKNPKPIPPRVTSAMVLDKLNEFIIEQRKHNDKVDARFEKQETLLNKVIKLNNLKTE